MRPTRQVKVVNSQLEGFVNLGNHLGMLLEDIKNITKKGECWLIGDDDETFADIIQSLDLEMESCLKTLCNIAAGNHNFQSDVLKESKDTYLPLMKYSEENNKILFTKCDELSSSSYLLSKKLKSLQEKYKTQAKLIETISRNYTTLDTKYNSRFDEIMTELHTASDFIQSQTEVFYEKVEQCEEKCGTEFNEKIENIYKKLNKNEEIFTQRQEEYEQYSDSNFNEIKMQIHTLTQTLSDLKEDNENVTSEVNETDINVSDIPNNIQSFNKEFQDVHLNVSTNELTVFDDYDNLQTLQRNYTDPTDKFTGQIEKIVCKDSPDFTADDYGQVVLVEDAISETYLYGNHETQVSEGGEADLHKYFIGCKKNPGHTDFIPVQTLTMNDLPEGYRDQDLFNIIKSTSDMTVRVDVKMTSPDRPKYWPHTKVSFPFYNMRGKTQLRTGSGKICWVSKCTNDRKWFNKKKCWCKKCKNSDKTSDLWWEFSVYTAMQVVFDDHEARHTSLRLFYNSEECPVVSVDQVKFYNDELERDSRLLKCVTCDKNVGEKLQLLFKYHLHYNDKICRNVRESRDVEKLTFIVSHLHGCCKHVSFGHWVDKYNIDKYDRRKLTYTTSTCPGSSGALVYCVGYSGRLCDLLHSGNLNSKLNFSGASLF